MLEVHNGHMYAAKLANSGLKVDLKSVPIPWDGLNSNIDLDRTVSLIREHRPALVSIGSARFLFPQPVRELREAMDRYCPGSFLLYDAAHVMGLIAGGRFQSPLAEGADVIVTSTHKTLAGPQGGMVLTNDRDVAERIAKAISPLMIANHHLSRLPSLAGDVPGVDGVRGGACGCDRRQCQSAGPGLPRTGRAGGGRRPGLYGIAHGDSGRGCVRRERTAGQKAGSVPYSRQCFRRSGGTGKARACASACRRRPDTA